jgi:NMD protein affecting ribosome stability and mRNA decay
MVLHLSDPCEHEYTSTAKTGDGVEVVTCLDCGEHIHIGDMPWPDDEPHAWNDLFAELGANVRRT